MRLCSLTGQGILSPADLDVGVAQGQDQAADPVIGGPCLEKLHVVIHNDVRQEELELHGEEETTRARMR